MTCFPIGVGFIAGLTPGRLMLKAVMDGKNVDVKALPSIICQSLFTAGIF